MLKKLTIKNFILILEAEIEFSSGLNIITGESGSGKSAILKAIDVVLGAKADISCIFPGKETATIEATFELKDDNEIRQTFSEYDLDNSKTIVLRREISRSGRSRSFINDQFISLAQIKECSIFFADYISQKQASSLSQEKYVNAYVDALSDCENEVDILSKLWSQSNNIYSEITQLLSEKIKLEKTIPLLKEELNWIEKIGYKQDEEKHLSQKHALLLTSHERKELFADICNQLQELPDSVLSKLRYIDKAFQKLQSLDSNAASLYKTFKNSFIEFEELGFELAKLCSSIDTDFSLLSVVEDRIKEVELLRKKFGLDFNAIESKKKQLLNEFQNFEKTDKKLLKLQSLQQGIISKIDELCMSITSKRKKTKGILERKMQKELDSLNLKNSSFELVLESKKRSSTGDENINFLFSANPNTKTQPLQKIASGGEIARVMLGLKCIIAEKDSHHCLIFDEIDSSVGGKSAAIIGDKLLKLSQSKQIICVTHFVQVAKKATSHFLIEKSQEKQQSITLISKLKNLQKGIEYQRMVGLNQL